MLEKKILHIDINHCYAQIMEMLYPELKNVPMAVGGNEERRSGIILARNLHAKKFGVKTAETLREAFDKCPNLTITAPDFSLFIYYSEMVKNIYREYTSHVESFGIDEAWLDITHSQKLHGDAEAIMYEIADRVLNEVGLTVSCGLSYNKIFAKLGSDLVKPSGRVVISKENFKEVVWPLNVEELLYVGFKTQEKLNAVKIMTIGDLANKTKEYMQDLLGKNGEMIWYFANGFDLSQVMENGYNEPVKSIGNSITTPEDIKNRTDAKIVFQVLAESVASRLRDAKLQAGVIAISLRDVELRTISRQRKIKQRTDISSEIMEVVISLLDEHYPFFLPLRSIGIKASDLSDNAGVYQLNFFQDESIRKRDKDLDICIDEIRDKYGFEVIRKLSTDLNKNLTDFNPKGEHVIYPVAWFK
ncbi:MAG: DNA polymerase IV [Erysipelothrix sp.]|nr:DNA polymerase IV [Erysipelothrix sp.]